MSELAALFSDTWGFRVSALAKARDNQIARRHPSSLDEESTRVRARSRYYRETALSGIENEFGVEKIPEDAHTVPAQDALQTPALLSHS
jgi:hypothetical protein